MLESLIRFFASRHLLVNLLTAAVFVGGVVFWRGTPKEEMPNVVFDWVRVSARYPGASASDVERLVTAPLEDAVRSIDGVRGVSSNSNVGSVRLSVELEAGVDDIESVVADIRNAAADARLPDDVEEDPRVRVFKTSKKAILDIGVYHSGYHLLDFKGRQEVQQAVRSLENQLLIQAQIHSINRSGYLPEEIHVRVRPADLYRYNISFDSVMRAIRTNHLRQPAGILNDGKESKVTLGAELDNPRVLNALVVQGGFEGRGVRLDKLATVSRQHAETQSVIKLNGHEGVMLNVVKTTDSGIIEALTAVHRVIDDFKRNQLADSRIELVLLDDESTDLRNRLSIITINAAIGFSLILVILFLFLDFRSGLWVGVGIPFTFCFSMIVLSSLGYTINNMTLAGVIIVMGMVVDDAIIVAEHVHRRQMEGMSVVDAAVRGTGEMVAPITAAVLTTCAAFLPMYFMESRWAQLNWVIPGVIFAMLGGSLFESVLILPSHLTLNLEKLTRLKRYLPFMGRSVSSSSRTRGHWFDRYEKSYGRALLRILPHRKKVFVLFAAVLVLAGLLVKFKFKYVMFPREETREVMVTAETPPGTTRYETARMAKEIEDLFVPYFGKEVVGLRTQVSRSRHGGSVQENKFRVVAEIVPKEKRDRSADDLIAEWKEALKGSKTLKNIRFAKSRWGQSSGSAIDIVVRGNDNAARERAAQAVLKAMEGNPNLKEAEIERDMQVPEYQISLKRDLLKRLSISPPTVAATFRAALQGSLLYEITGGDEEIKVRFMADEESKSTVENLLRVPVENQRGYLVPLGDLVNVKETTSSSSISRRDGRRITHVYANLAEDGKQTPEEVAVDLERGVFQALLSSEPSISLEFDGEIRETRETRGDLKNAVFTVVVLIYVILSVLFNSLTMPFIIMLAIPFGAVGVVLAFTMHGIFEFGFFAMIGILGLAGVVVNDAIVMVFTVRQALKVSRRGADANPTIAASARTRLKAVVLTTLTTSAAIFPTAYGFAGYDAMLAQMMLAMAWGLIFGTAISLVLVPCLYASLVGREGLPA